MSEKMEASAEMKWGLICSIDDQENVKEYIDFSIWMVNQLEISASKLQLGHRFDETPTFVLHAIPGSIDQSRECYETIAKQHPQVIYVIHILPSKDSLEYQVLKEHTLAGALVGQGVLAENALAYFKCYELVEVMANMNQWIGRRLAQITARRTLKNFLIKKLFF
ncbi:unnamed protein product [Meloidogyne enterolobii]|uniref:Uncharacterized protein n=1 Tax=Meloidogyne enterolobii TaxID=390850 RepID=A0ACB1AK15_MELEN